MTMRSKYYVTLGTLQPNEVHFMISLKLATWFVKLNLK